MQLSGLLLGGPGGLWLGPDLSDPLALDGLAGDLPPAGGPMARLGDWSVPDLSHRLGSPAGGAARAETSAGGSGSPTDSQPRPGPGVPPLDFARSPAGARPALPAAAPFRPAPVRPAGGGVVPTEKADAQIAWRAAYQGGPGPLTPVFVYSSYRGGATEDADNGVKVKPDGTAVVAGYSVDAGTGIAVATITMFSPTGSMDTVSGLSFPGATSTKATGIDLDGAGNIYLVGTTDAAGSPDAFVAKLSPSASTVLWATLLGGPGMDAGSGIKVDPAGLYVYMTGSYDDSATGGFAEDLLAAKLETVGGTTSAGGWSLFYVLVTDGFAPAESAGTGLALNFLGVRITGQNTADLPDPLIVGLTHTGSFDLGWTFLPGGGGSNLGVVTDPAGFTYFAGYLIDPAVSADKQLFIGKYDPTLAAALWDFTYLSSGSWEGNAIAVDPFTSAPYVAGAVDSDTPGADVFVGKFSPDGALLTDAAIFGGSGPDVGNGLALDPFPLPSAYVVGVTSSPDFPVTLGAAQTVYGGPPSDGFITKVAGLT